MLRRLYDWIIAKAAHPKASWWLAFFAFADGGLFPAPPHPLLALMCLSRPDRALRYAAITTIASIAGGIFGYFVGHFLYDTVGQELLSLLGLTRKFPVAACYLDKLGVKIIIAKSATPIPFLLLSVTAGFIGFPLLKFVVASLLSRGVLFFGLGILFRVFGPPIQKFIDKYFAWVVVAAVVLIIGVLLAIDHASSGPSAEQTCAHATTVPR